MKIKIRFENSVSMTIGKVYTLINNQINEKVNLACIGISRIDGLLIFESSQKVTLNDNYSYNGNKVKNTYILNEINKVDSDELIKNKEMLLEFFMNKYKISDHDLYLEDSYKSIIRDIKISDIIK